MKVGGDGCWGWQGQWWVAWVELGGDGWAKGLVGELALERGILMRIPCLPWGWCLGGRLTQGTNS